MNSISPKLTAEITAFLTENPNTSITAVCKRFHISDKTVKKIRRELGIGRAYYGHSDTVCWTCNRACGGCSWSRCPNPAPVEGWVAERRDIYMKVNLSEVCPIESYVVRECPEYAPDKKQRKKEMNSA